MRRSAVLAVAALGFVGLGPARAAEAPKPKAEGVIAIEALTAAIPRPGGRHGVLSIEAELDVPDAKLHARALQSIPRLRDAYTRFVLIYAGGLAGGAVPNPDYIGGELQRATDRVLGRPGARVLLGSIAVN